MSGENDMSYLIRRAHKTHMSIKSHSRFGTHGKRTYQLRLPQVSYSIRHTQKVYMLSKIDLKSRALFRLGTDRRFADFLSYFKTLSLGRMDSIQGYSSFLKQSTTVVIL